MTKFLCLVYRTGKDSPIIIEEFGLWNSINGINDTRKIKSLSQRRQNLRGKILTACFVIGNNDTLNHLNDYEDKHIDAVTKVNYVLVKYLIEKMNASMNFTYEPIWALYNKTTKQWHGMIGQLLNGEADIGGTALFVTIDRISLIEYLSMVTPTMSKFVFRAPPLSYVANIYTLPFDSKVWMSLGGFLVIIIILVFITYSFEEYYITKNTNINKTRLLDIVILTVGAMCQMGSQREPKSSSGRIATIFLFITMVFLYTSYTANIVALLQSSTKSIRTLDDLMNSQLEFGVEDTPYNRFYLPVKCFNF